MRARSLRLRLLCTLLLFLGLARAALGAPTSAPASGTEWVLILDNSASMAGGSKLTANGVTTSLPPTDPDRLSVLATLIFRALLDPSDRLTILTFRSGGKGLYEELPARPESIRSLVFSQSTPFSGPLRRAREILTQSPLPMRRLLLVTDGGPSEDDMLDASQARALLGLDQAAGRPEFTVRSLGLTGGSPQMAALQQEFLGPLGELSRIDSARELVSSFTQVFAAHIHSRPESGELLPGGSFSFPVGRYVTAVLVDMATSERSGTFRAELLADGVPLSTEVEFGDNGCAAPPCHTYQVMKAEHDPQRSQRFTLRVTGGSGKVAYGIILRYDLAAEIVKLPSSAEAGEEVEVRARMLFHGQTFNDAAFFASDGFSASLELEGASQPLTLLPDGTFQGRIKPASMGAKRLLARFTNHWLSLSAEAELKVNEWPPLSLRVRPDPLDFGTWRGERAPTERCAELDLSSSSHVEAVPLEIVASGLPEGVTLTAAAPLRLISGRTRVCLQASGCCKALRSPEGARLQVRGRDPHYHAAAGTGAVTVGIAFAVERTPFLTCWWRTLMAIAAALLMGIVLWGFIHPADFDADATIYLAKDESGLARSTGRRLRDLPLGRRGFYRDARVMFDSSGNTAHSQGGAALILRATRGEPAVGRPATIEQKDPRTRKWEALPAPTELGALRRGIAYRCGTFYFRLG